MSDELLNALKLEIRMIAWDNHLERRSRIVALDDILKSTPALLKPELLSLPEFTDLNDFIRQKQTSLSS